MCLHYFSITFEIIFRCVCVSVCVYRAKAIAVQTVSVMITFNPEVTIRDSDVTILVAQSPAVKKEDELCAYMRSDSQLQCSKLLSNRWCTAGGLASYLMKSPSRPITRLMIFCWGFLGDLEEQEKAQKWCSVVTVRAGLGQVWTTQTSTWSRNSSLHFHLSSFIHHFHRVEDQSWMTIQRANGI